MWRALHEHEPEAWPVLATGVHEGLLAPPSLLLQYRALFSGLPRWCAPAGETPSPDDIVRRLVRHGTGRVTERYVNRYGTLDEWVLTTARGRLHVVRIPYANLVFALAGHADDLADLGMPAAPESCELMTALCTPQARPPANLEARIDAWQPAHLDEHDEHVETMWIVGICGTPEHRERMRARLANCDDPEPALHFEHVLAARLA